MGTELESFFRESENHNSHYIDIQKVSRKVVQLFIGKVSVKSLLKIVPIIN